MKCNEPRLHHYVPAAYQSGFADVDGLLWLYDRRTQRYTKTHPRVICCENNLYTIDPEGVEDCRIETQCLSQIDGDAITAIRQLGKGVQLDRDWMESFSIFIAFLITRTPAYRALITQNYQATGEEYLRIGFTDVDRARQLLENYQRETGDRADGVTAKSLVDAVVGGHLHISVTERPFLEHMFRQVELLARWIRSFDWQIMEASPESGFIICDYPFVIVPSPQHPDLIGFGFPGTVKYLPLTKGLCLRMGEQGYEFSYVRIGRTEVRMVNQNTAVNSERFIMGPNRAQLEHIIARSGASKPHPKPRTGVDVLQRDRDGSLIRFNLWPRRAYFYTAW